MSSYNGLTNQSLPQVFRSMLGFAFPLFGKQMYGALGEGGGNTVSIVHILCPQEWGSLVMRSYLLGSQSSWAFRSQYGYTTKEKACAHGTRSHDDKRPEMTLR